MARLQHVACWRLATDADRPLLERVRFLAIFSSNLDEFFQVRVSGLLEQREAGLQQTTFDGMTPSTQLAAIRERVVDFMAAVAVEYRDVLRPRARKGGHPPDRPGPSSTKNSAPG